MIAVAIASAASFLAAAAIAWVCFKAGQFQAEGKCASCGHGLGSVDVYTNRCQEMVVRRDWTHIPPLRSRSKCACTTHTAWQRRAAERAAGA